MLKESTFQMENRINEEVVKKRAVKSTYWLAFLTDLPEVLSTDTIEVYDSCDVHDALDSTYENLLSAIEDFQQRGSSRIRPTPSYFVHATSYMHTEQESSNQY